MLTTVRIRRMGEGNSFSLLVCSHPTGGTYLGRGVPTLAAGWGGGGGYVTWTYLGWWMVGVPTLASQWGVTTLDGDVPTLAGGQGVPQGRCTPQPR